MTTKRGARPRVLACGATPRASRSGLASVVGVVVLAIALSVALFAGGQKATPGATVEIAGHVTVDGNALPVYVAAANDAAQGRTAPTLRGVGFDGTRVVIAPSDRPTAVFFLAHWCPHCQAEVPRIVALAREGTTNGVNVFAVATGTAADRDNFPPSKWLAREHWPFRVLVDTAGFTAARAYGLSAYPFMVFLDAQGAVVGRLACEVAPDELAAVFEALVTGRALPIAGPGASSGA